MKTKESQKKTVYCIYPSEESKGNYKKIQNVVTKKDEDLSLFFDYYSL